MSSFTGRLGLKRNDGSDPFLRQDFVDNWNRLDAAPGTHICTSTTRPTWTAAQQGRLILETDTGSLYQWNGSTWVDPQAIPTYWSAALVVNATLAKNVTANYTLRTINVPRAGVLAIHAGVRAGVASTSQAGVSFYPMVDGVLVPISGQGSYLGFPADSSGSSDYREAPIIGYASVAAGSHTIGMRVTVANLAAGITLANFRALVTLVRNGS